jgi:two-component system cell cycle response regulator DivK
MKSNILCIEEHSDNLTLIRRIFRPDRYNLLEAKTGIQGLSVAESQDLDLTLLDINLPDIDGYEVVRRIWSSTRSALVQTPIIAVTASTLKGDSQKAHDGGCDVYMSKPVNIIELMDTANAFVRKCEETHNDL